MRPKCDKCGDDMSAIMKKGGRKWLARKDGGPWICQPSCNAKLTNEQAVLGAISGEVPTRRRGRH